jgi:hypothetical protein
MYIPCPIPLSMWYRDHKRRWQIKRCDDCRRWHDGHGACSGSEGGYCDAFEKEHGIEHGDPT